MIDPVDLYPANPADVPADLTRPTTSYRLRVLIVLVSLFLFAFLYLGLVLGSAYLCYWSFTPSGPTDSGRSVLQQAARVEERVSRVVNNAVEQAKQGRLNDAGFLEILERDVLPPWRAECRRLAQVKGLSGEERRLVNQLQRSFKVQEEAWELLAQAIRHNDRGAAAQSQQKAKEAEQLARQFSADAGRYYSRHAPQTSDGSFWWVIVGICSGVLCLFLVKGFFKRRRADQALRLELTEQEQPLLFAFIRRLCRDTGAAFPRRIYVTPEVNAAVFYHESFLNLFLPARKNLVIGLGLVNRLNLTEFKAVLAHEFGHFSQHSMKLGSYVYSSNRIVAEIVFGRDWLDSVIAQLRNIDMRIAIFAWGFTSLLWVVRKSLQGLFNVINFANSALSRQMEFNADLMAVSVTGSDALIHALARLDFANESLTQAWRDLTAAGDHELYTRDLFYHQTHAAEHVRRQRKDPSFGEPPPLAQDPAKATQVFQPGDLNVPLMWATHPSNFDREQNVKRRYLRAPIDERSPWLLFQEAAALREKVTRQFYQAVKPGQEITLSDAQVVQAFIDDEHAETSYHPRYHGMFDRRFITPGHPDDLMPAAAIEFRDPARLAQAQAELYGNDLKDRVHSYHSRQDEFSFLAGLVDGSLKLTARDFVFRTERFQAADAQRLLEQVRRELDEDNAWLAELDRQFFVVHYQMARQVDDAACREMEQRYRFHLALQELLGDLSNQNHQVQLLLGQLAGHHEISQEWFQHALGVLQAAHDSLCRDLETADCFHFPALKNMTPGQPLGQFLMNRPLIHRLTGHETSLDGQWVQQFLQQLGEVIDKSQRIHFKSLGGILALQENIAERWAAAHVGEAAVTA